MYVDLIHTLRKLTDVQRGKLMLIIWEYVNDENPTVDDPIIDIVFEPIKRQLKRDLLRYEKKKKQWSDAGKASAEARRLRAEQTLTDVEGCSTDSTVNVNVNDTVTVNDNNNIYKSSGHLEITWDEFNKLVDEFGNVKSDDMVNKVLNYRKNSKYKSLYLTALNWLRKEKYQTKSGKLV